MSKHKIALSLEMSTEEAHKLLEVVKKSDQPLDSELVNAIIDFAQFDGDAKITLIRKDE